MPPSKLPTYADIEPLPSYRQSEADAEVRARDYTNSSSSSSEDDVYDEDAEQAFYDSLAADPPILGSFPRSARTPNLDVVEEDDEDDDEDDEVPPYQQRRLRDSLEIQHASMRAEVGPDRADSEMEDLRKRVEEIRIEAEKQSKRSKWREGLSRKGKEGKIAMWVLGLKIWRHEKTVKSVAYYAIREAEEEDRRQGRVREHAERLVDWQIERERMQRVHRFPRYTNAYMDYQHYVRSGQALRDRQTFGFQQRSCPAETEAERRQRKLQESEDREVWASNAEAQRLGWLSRRIGKDARNRVKEAQMLPKRAKKRIQAAHWRDRLAALKAVEAERAKLKRAKEESRVIARREARRDIRLQGREYRKRKEAERLRKEKNKRMHKEKREARNLEASYGRARR